MIIDLESKIGLNIKFNPENNQLVFEDPEIVIGRFDIRTFREISRYIKNKSSKFPLANAYYMYRGLHRKSDEEKINSLGFRFDITVIPAGSFIRKDKKEFARTAGHYHEIKAGTGLGFPEIYEVVSGNALWLMQKPEESDFSKLSKIYSIEAGPGEKAIVLPGYGHISINTSNEPLVLADWIGNNFKYNYEPYKNFRGGGYWVMQGKTGEISFERNENYTRVPELKKLKPRELPEFGLFKTEPLYRLVHDLSRLRFLVYPEEFEEKLTVENCYEQV